MSPTSKKQCTQKQHAPISIANIGAELRHKVTHANKISGVARFQAGLGTGHAEVVGLM